MGCLLGSLVCFLPSAAEGATIQPDTRFDDPDTGCTLREAITAVNSAGVVMGGCSASGAFGVNDTIVLDATLGDFLVEIPSAAEDFNFNGDLDIRADVVIVGINGTAHVAGAGTFDDRIFDIPYRGSGLARVVTFDTLIIEDGNLNGDDGCGAGIHVAELGTSLDLVEVTVQDNVVHDGVIARGGGVCVEKEAVVTGSDCLITFNEARDGSNESLGGGLAIDDQGTIVDLIGCRIDENEVYGSPSLAGGGVAIQPGADFILDSGVVKGNLVHTNTASGGLSFGAGIALLGVVALAEPLADLSWSTVSDNEVLVGPQTGRGGGIYVFSAALILYTSTVDHNRVTDARGQAVRIEGGAIWMESPEVSISYSTISYNTLKTAGSAPASGGGIFVDTPSSATVPIWNSTISGNSVVGVNGNGGALWAANAIALDIWFSTVADNTQTGGAGIGGLYLATVLPGRVALKATIIDNINATGNCGGPTLPVSFGYNIETGASCVLSGLLDLPMTNPLLFPLANYGGPTQTHKIDMTSPAFNYIFPAFCTDMNGTSFVMDDQRLFPRPVYRKCDVGAYELP